MIIHNASGRVTFSSSNQKLKFEFVVAGRNPSELLRVHPLERTVVDMLLAAIPVFLLHLVQRSLLYLRTAVIVRHPDFLHGESNHGKTPQAYIARSKI